MSQLKYSPCSHSLTPRIVFLKIYILNNNFETAEITTHFLHYIKIKN